MSNNEAGSASPKCLDLDDWISGSDESSIIQNQSQDDLDAIIRAPPSLHLQQELVLEMAQVVLGRLSTISQADDASNLDWALVELKNAEISHSIFTSISGDLEVSTLAAGIAPSKAEVLVIAGSNGIINGTISGSLTFMQLPTGITFQEMWTVRLNGAVCE